jgi:hypothetical protein
VPDRGEECPRDGLDVAACDAEGLGELRAPHLLALLCAGELRLRKRELGMGPRGVDARPQVLLDERLDHACEHLRAAYASLRSRDALVPLDQPEEGVGHRQLHLEPAPSGPRLSPAALGCGDVNRRRLSHEGGHVPRCPHTHTGLEDARVECPAAR